MSDRAEKHHDVRFKVHFGQHEVKATAYRGRRRIGFISVGKTFSRDSLSQRGREAIEALSDVAGRPLLPYYPWFVEIDPGERGLGTGVDLYVCAVDAVGTLGGALLPSYLASPSCTSTDARRVWSSRRFAERVILCPVGVAAYTRLSLPS